MEDLTKNQPPVSTGYEAYEPKSPTNLEDPSESESEEVNDRATIKDHGGEKKSAEAISLSEHWSDFQIKMIFQIKFFIHFRGVLWDTIVQRCDRK